MIDKAAAFKVGMLILGIGAFAWLANSEGDATGYIHNRSRKKRKKKTRR